MNFSLIAIWLLFVFSVALSVTGVLFMFRLKHKAPASDFKEVHYALVILYSFGFYVLWGQLFIKIIVATTSYSLNSDAIVNLNQAFGIPFLSIGFVLLNFWLYQFSEVRHKLLFLLLGIFAVFVLSMAHYIYYSYSFWENAIELNKVILALFSLWFVASLMLFCKCIKQSLKLATGAAFMLLSLSNLLSLFFLSGHVVVISVLNFIYFLAASLIPVSLYYGLIQKQKEVSLTGLDSREALLQKNGITAREKEIIKEIASGLTNQQIADKLFITLQTVKDHNSRIYQKLDVRNRTQLVKRFHDDGQ